MPDYKSIGNDLIYSVNKINVMVGAMLMGAGMIAPAMSEAALADSPLRLVVENTLLPSTDDPSFPMITVQDKGGSSCWIAGDLGDWNIVVTPLARREFNSRANAAWTDGCAFGRNTHFAFFIQNFRGDVWHPITFKFYASAWSYGLGMNIVVKDWLGNDPLKVGEYKGCGLTLSFRKQELYMNEQTIAVSGHYDVTQCKVVTIWADQGSYTPEASERDINIKRGKSKTVTLPLLDPESNWELDNGGCEGGAVAVENEFNKTKSKTTGQVIEKVTFKAINEGTSVCDFTAYNNPARTINTRIRLNMNVKP